MIKTLWLNHIMKKAGFFRIFCALLLWKELKGEGMGVGRFEL